MAQAVSIDTTSRFRNLSDSALSEEIGHAKSGSSPKWPALKPLSELLPDAAVLVPLFEAYFVAHDILQGFFNMPRSSHQPSCDVLEDEICRVTEFLEIIGNKLAEVKSVNPNWRRDYMEACVTHANFTKEYDRDIVAALAAAMAVEVEENRESAQ